MLFTSDLDLIAEHQRVQKHAKGPASVEGDGAPMPDEHPPKGQGHQLSVRRGYAA